MSNFNIFTNNHNNDVFLNENNMNLKLNNQSILTPSSYYQPMDDVSKATLWMGDLEPWMDENYLKQLWTSYGENVIIKLIRDKRTGSGYAFIGFHSVNTAQRILNTVHGSRMPNSTKLFKLNWASGGGIYDRKEDRAPEYSLFVGDLSNDIDETYLLSLFRTKYPSCHSAKIMTDPVTGLSRGYGFVRFLNQLEQQEAVLKMNGILCKNRPLRVSFATPKSNNNNNSTAPAVNSNSLMNSNLVSYYQQLEQQQRERYHQLELQAPALIHQPTDPNNTTVFVGGLSSPVTEDQLGQYFSSFGEITYVKIPPGKGCGFVQYVHRSSAEQAIEKMNGFSIGNSRIRLSWGRSQADKSNELSPSTLSTTSFKPLSPILSQNNLWNQQVFNTNKNDWLFQQSLFPNNSSISDNDNWHLNGLI